MSINHKELARSLSVIAENPKKIKEAEEKCKAALADIRSKEASGNWSPNAIKRMKEEAIAERDRVCHALAHAMRPALETIKQNNSPSQEPLDINSPKIQNAVNVLSLMGKNLTFADQASILESFRGDPAALRFLQSAFQKNGLKFAAQQAGEMMRGVSQQAISQVEEVLNFHDYAESQGRYDFPADRMVWTHGEFQRQIDRMGYEPSNADPFLAAIDDVANAYASETSDPNAQGFYKYLAQMAKAEIYRDGKDGAEVFNKAVQDMELKAAAVAAEQAQAE